VSVVTSCAVVLVELANLDEFVGMLGIYDLNLLNICLLAFSVQLIKVVDGICMLLLRLVGKHILRLQLHLKSLDFTRLLLLVSSVVGVLRVQALGSGRELLLEVGASSLITY
jgi:hypothetical protein